MRRKEEPDAAILAAAWQLAARLRDVEDDRNKFDSNRWGRSSASHGTTGIFRPVGHEELEDGER